MPEKKREPVPVGDFPDEAWNDFLTDEWLSLRHDGETAEFVVLTAPEIITVKSQRYDARKVARIKVLTPCDSSGRIALLDLGPRAARRYAPIVRGHERTALIEITRIGGPGETSTTYRFRLIRQLDAGEIELVNARLLEDAEHAATAKPTAGP